MSETVPGLLLTIGLLLIMAGLWMVYPPLALIAIGCASVLLSIGLEKQVNRKGNGAQH